MQLPLVLLTLLPSPPAPPAVTLHRITAATYAQARRAAKPVQVPTTFPIKPLNGQFVIPTSSGPQTFRDVVIDEKAIANGHSEDESTNYVYHGFSAGFRRHVVEVTFYETGEWWLISPEGRRLTLYGKPVYAPDQQSIATICPGLEYSGGQPNALQIFRLQNGTLRPFWEVRPTSWEPEELFWVDKNTLYLKREEYPGGRQGAMSYWKLAVAAKPE
ncbi:hypothetical protein ACFPAF_15465 [Hymenobacter endophyticus]|uniref:Uncharacterized protein n=1 Tax=Hymenobacter endophyticus TaxID=3076335 RepID=A0ABU3TK95_9BACT|nr:hypothetical protein [Hymenobacter endophyticus]MDU0371800.1 hypothetical protein [Hymenobacter endophyticus]